MNFAKSVVQGMMGMFLMDGVDVDDIDFENGIFYLTIPKSSYIYDKNENIKTPEDYAKRLKKKFNDLHIFSVECRIKFKVKDIVWTMEMGDLNYKLNKHKIVDLTLWDK